MWHKSKNYMSFGSNLLKEYFILKIGQKQTGGFYLMSDLNILHISWVKLTCNAQTQCSKKQLFLLLLMPVRIS